MSPPSMQLLHERGEWSTGFWVPGEYRDDEYLLSHFPLLADGAAARENHGEDDPLFKGMQLVHDKALETLGRFGVKVIQAEGQPFDPERHTAIMQQPADDCKPNTVVQEVQRGYQLRGRTIRPAAVVVSRAPEPTEDQDNEAPRQE